MCCFQHQNVNSDFVLLTDSCIELSAANCVPFWNKNIFSVVTVFYIGILCKISSLIKSHPT